MSLESVYSTRDIFRSAGEWSSDKKDSFYDAESFDQFFPENSSFGSLEDVLAREGSDAESYEELKERYIERRAGKKEELRKNFSVVEKIYRTVFEGNVEKSVQRIYGMFAMKYLEEVAEP